MTVEVTQADRDAAAALFLDVLQPIGSYAEWCYSSDRERAELEMAEAFARHRIAHQGQVSGDVVERVARALAQADGIQICNDATYAQSSYRGRALAAIAVMPAPTCNDSLQVPTTILTGDVAELARSMKALAEHIREPLARPDLTDADTCDEAAAKLIELAAEVERLRAKKD